MITRNDLMGKEIGLNPWGRMTYETGLIQEYLPGESDYHHKDFEGYFLASLCLYLLSPVKNTSSKFFPIETDHIFLNYFLFQHIPENSFRAKMAKCLNERQKIKIILELIQSQIIMIPSGNPSCCYTRFHDYYMLHRRYINHPQYATKEQKIIFSQWMLELYKKGELDETILSWESFCEICKNHNINTLNNENSKIFNLIPQFKKSLVAPTSHSALASKPDMNFLFSKSDRQAMGDLINTLEMELHGFYVRHRDRKKQKIQALGILLDLKKTDCLKGMLKFLNTTFPDYRRGIASGGFFKNRTDEIIKRAVKNVQNKIPSDEEESNMPRAGH